MHRDCFNEEAILSNFDAPKVFQGITSELIEEKVLKTAELFYQIGKAYLTKGIAAQCRFQNNRTLKKVRHDMKARPISIEKATLKAGRLFREMGDLSKSSGLSNRRYKRAESFFRNTRKNKSDLLEVGRNLLTTYNMAFELISLVLLLP